MCVQMPEQYLRVEQYETVRPKLFILGHLG